MKVVIDRDETRCYYLHTGLDAERQVDAVQDIPDHLVLTYTRVMSEMRSLQDKLEDLWRAKHV